jgi:hypothetical protein
LSADIRSELGLICACCGTCKTGQKTTAADATKTAEGTDGKTAAAAEQKTPAGMARAKRLAAIEADYLAKGLARTEAIQLNAAADIVCQY